MTNPEAQRLAAEGQGLLDANRLPEAKTHYEKICAQDPDNAEAHFILGTINAESGELDAAISQLRKSLALDPDSPDAQHVLATVLNTRGEHKDALTHAERATALDPEFAEAWLLLGSVNALLDNLDDAESACRKAVDLGLSSFDACLTLGDICRIRGKLKDAGDYLGKAVKLNPDSASAWLLLGAVQGMLGNNQQAEASCRRSVELNPDNADAQKNLGNTLKDQDRYEEAITVYQQAIQLDAGNGDAWLGLGTCYSNLGNVQQGERCYRQVVELRPDSADGYSFLGGILQMTGKFEEAEGHVRHAMQISPNFPGINNQLANILFARNKLDEAAFLYDWILERTPEDPNAIVGLAAIHERRKEYQQSLDLLRPLLECEPPDYSAVMQHSNLSRHFGHQREAIELMERLLDQKSLSHFQRARLHYNLGKLHDSEDNYPQAFEHIHHANEIAAEPFDMSQHERHVDELIQAFGEPALPMLPRATNMSTLPVFIVGMPRTGTSLVEQIIATHPRVFGAGELDDMNLIAEGLSARAGVDKPYPEAVASVTQPLLDELAQAHLQKLAGMGGDAIRVTDKMPTNFLHLGLIDLLFPGARIIHCTRDPRDTGLSCYFRYFAGNHPYSKNLRHLGSYYNQYARIMQHWKQVLRIPIMEVQYETLVERPEETSRALLEFCGLEWDDRCLKFYESDRIVNTASYDQVTRPIYNKSVRRWRKYEKELAPLIDALDSDILATYDLETNTG